MAEAVVIVGAVAAFSQLAKYGAGLARYMLSCPSEIQSIPATVEDLIEHLDWHRRVVQSLQIDPNCATGPSVQHLISRSLRITLSLQQLLTPLLSNESESKVKKLRRVFSYQKRIRKIAKYRSELESCERRLILHFSAFACRNTHHDVQQASSTSATLRGTPGPPGILVDLPPRSRFIGRDSTLCLVSRTLAAPGGRTCLVGPGGVGKSEAAKECAYRLHDLYPEVSFIWIQARDRSALQTSYDRLFGGTEILTKFDAQAPTIQDIMEKLDMVWEGQWVLIVDDVQPTTNRDLALRQLASLPIKNGSILFTTRNTYVAALLVEDRFILTLDPMTVGEATQMLRAHLDSGFSLDEDFSSLLEYLEYLPSPIAQAAESMRLYKLSTVQYFRLLRGQEKHVSYLLSPVDSNCYHMIGPLGTEPLSIVSMQSLYEQDENAADLLAVMACLGNGRIPFALFDDSYSLSRLINAIAVLRGSYLISISDIDHTITVPRLVRLSVRNFLRQHRISSIYAFRTLQLVAQSFPETDKQYSMLTKCGLYLPHALAILEEYGPRWTSGGPCCSQHTVSTHNEWLALTCCGKRGHDSVDSYHLGARASQESSSWDFLAPLALRVSHFLRILGQYKNALHLAGHALKWLSHADHSNPSSVEIFLCESSIATLSHYLGRPTSFASRVELLLQSQTVLLKSHRPLTIRALRSKGLALQAQGRHDQAEGYHRRAIAICTSIYGHRDTKLLDEKHGLALSILGQGRAQEALGTLHDIYNVMEATLGLSNPKTLSVLANIGCALQHLSQWTEAYGVMTRALSGRNAVLGKDHPHTIHSRANLAQIYVAKGDMAGAERITKETLQIHEAKLGEDHHLSLHILNSLGYLFLGQDRYTEAAEVLHRVARKREIVLGSQHCDTLTSMFYASEAYWRMGRLDEAFELGHRVLNGRRRLNEGDASMREIEERLAEIERDRWLELMR